ncbi:MAG: phenylacetate--CoA ligase family protein [Calditrichaeota bacterium]|nr:MAG: phenylacetate--CoA ligase family protein [Calditrichota bacterium]
MRKRLADRLKQFVLPERRINPELQISWQERLRLLPHLHVLVQLKRFENLPRAEIRRHQLAALHRLADFAARRIPFYRQRLPGALSPSLPTDLDSFLARLPLAQREEMRTAFPEGFLPPECDWQKYALQDRTSGTTSAPFHFFKDLRSSAYEHYRRSLYRMELGLPYHAPELIVKGHTRPFQAESPFILKESPYRFRVDGFAISRKNIDQVLKLIHDCNIRVISGYPSSVDNLFHLAYQKGARLPVTHVLTTGEALYEHQQDFWKNAFGVKVAEIYGTAECMNIAFRCPEGKGYHVDEQRYLVELSDVSTVGKGIRRGRLLITDLKNYVMPFIRYDLGDWVWIDENPCTCGSPFRRILTVEAREQDQVVTPSGKILDLRFFIDEIIWDVSSRVRQFQVVCDGSSLELCLKTMNGPLPSALEMKMKRILTAYVEDSMEVRICYHRPFIRGATGKHKYLVLRAGSKAAASTIQNG